MIYRSQPFRSKDHLAFVRSLPCLICGKRSEACHVGGHGMSQKAPDNRTVPLCNYHHKHAPHALDRGRRAFESHYQLNLEAVIQWLTRKPRLTILQDDKGREWIASLPGVAVEDYRIGPVSQFPPKQAIQSGLQFFSEQVVESLKIVRQPWLIQSANGENF